MFTPYDVDASDIKVLSDTVYRNAVNQNDYESLCYSIYFAIRFDFVLEEFENNYYRAQDYVIKSKDCLLLIMTWIYFMVTSKNSPHHIEKIAKCCIIKANEVRR